MCIRDRDRTVAQNVNDHIVFSDEYENVNDQSYIYSIMDHANVVLTGGVGEGKDRILESMGNLEGVDRIEIFNDQRGLSKSKEDTDEEYTCLLYTSYTEKNKLFNENKELYDQLTGGIQNG